MIDTEKAIIVEGLHKTFKLPLDNHTGVKQKLINLLSGKRKKGYETQHVLKGVNFEINHGEFFGIVGRNGSGKSTLLKTLAGIYTPDRGGVQINGSLVPFIELGVGFNPELSGRENVFLNGALLGFSHSDMERMYDDIVDFAELHRFMDQKLKNYSSGMQVRLAFSIAIRADGDILLLDEVLAVGDEAFQKKCKDYFQELKRKKKTVILVTHDMKAVEEICDRGILLDKGEISVNGSNESISLAYSDLFVGNKEGKENGRSNSIESFTVTTNSTDKSTAVKPFEKIVIGIDINSKEEILEDIVIGMNIKSENGTVITALGVGGEGEPTLSLKKGANSVVIEVQNIFRNGVYTADILMVDYRNENRRVMYELLDKTIFVSKDFIGRDHALVRPEYNVQVNSKE